MSYLSLDDVIEVINTYLKECLQADAQKIVINTEPIEFDGTTTNAAFFLLSQCPGIQIQGFDFAYKVQFHGHLKGRTPAYYKDFYSQTENPKIIVLNKSGSELSYITGNTQQQLIERLREKIIFITPHSSSMPNANKTDSISNTDIISRLKELEKKVDLMYDTWKTDRY